MKSGMCSVSVLQENPEFGSFGASYFQSQQCVSSMLVFCFGLLQSELCLRRSRSDPHMRGFSLLLLSVLGLPHSLFPLLLFVKGLNRGKGWSVMGSAASWGAKELFLVMQSFGGGCRMQLPTFPVSVWVRCPQGERWWRKLGSLCSAQEVNHSSH